MFKWRSSSKIIIVDIISLSKLEGGKDAYREVASNRYLLFSYFCNTVHKAIKNTPFYNGIMSE